MYLYYLHFFKGQFCWIWKSWLTGLGFSLRLWICLSAAVWTDEKPAITIFLFLFIWWIITFLLLLRFPLIFGFQPFNCNMSRCGFLCFYLGFAGLLSICRLNVFHKVKNFSASVSSNIFLASFSFPFQTPNSGLLVCLVLSHRSLRICSFHLHFFSFKL